MPNPHPPQPSNGAAELVIASRQSVQLVTAVTFGLPFYRHGTHALAYIGMAGNIALLMAGAALVQLRKGSLGSL